MKTSEVLVCGSCLVLALTFMLCDANPGWRPQGRFGKRTHVSHLPRVVETASSDEGISNLMEVPVELLYSRADLSQLKTKPWLCSNSRIPGYPACGGSKKRSSSSLPSSLSSSSRVKNLNDLAEYFSL